MGGVALRAPVPLGCTIMACVLASESCRPRLDRKAATAPSASCRHALTCLPNLGFVTCRATNVQGQSAVCGCQHGRASRERLQNYLPGLPHSHMNRRHCKNNSKHVTYNVIDAKKLCWGTVSGCSM
ncbi:uncharacterized protein LOC144153064 [Haemaphysalis longicornis]